ncbi:DNA polymerase III subunit delta [Anoxybacillus thermarum]
MKNGEENMEQLYVIYGTEHFLMKQAYEQIVRRALPDEEREWNVSTYDCEETPIEVALEDAETLPFFGERKIVIVKQPYFLTAEKGKEKVEHDMKRLEAYIEKPAPFSSVIFVGTYEKLDERKKVTKALLKKAHVIVAKPLNEKELKQWVKGQCQIDDDAIDVLLTLAGTDLATLANEIEKLMLFAEHRSITASDVRLLVSRTLEQNVFTLVEQMAKRNVPAALQTLQDLLRQNEEPIKLVALLASQFRLIYEVKELMKTGYGQQQIASMLGVHPFRVKVAASYASGFSEQQLMSILYDLAETDYALKSSAMDKQLLLQLFFLKLQR